MAALGGCSHTRLVASDDQARIYVDGRMAGRGEVEVAQFGPPTRVQVIARSEDGRRRRVELRREFRPSTFGLGLITYGVCWVVCWAYPDAVRLELPARRSAGWDDAPVDDPWLAPPPATPPPSAPPAAPPP